MIAIDLDGVLADFTYGFTSLGHRMFGLPVVSSHHAPEWPFDWYATPEQIAAIWDTINQSRTFWEDLPPLITDDTFGVIDGYWHIIFVTTRIGKNVKEQTEEWLGYHGVMGAEVIVTTNKSLVEDIGVVVDDNPTLWYNKDSTQIYIPSWPYNRIWHDRGVVFPTPDEAIRSALLHSSEE